MDLFTTDPGLTFLVLFSAALIGPLAARAAKIPDIVGLLLAGLLIGPTGIGLVAREGLAVSLGDIGLLLLMFTAGLNLDLDGMARRRRAAATFGVLSWLLPSAAVVAVAHWQGLDLPAGLILASAVASHTLLTLPAVTVARQGNRDVAVVTVGGTLITTVLALLTLAAAVFVATEPPPTQYLQFGGKLAAFTILVLWVVPRAARWLLTRLVSHRELRLTVLLAGMLALAAVSAPLGVEPIVGAFLAGLAFNRYVPTGSVLHDRLTSVSDGLFVPIFLLATGMLIDLRLLVDLQVLTLAAALMGALAVSKLAALAPVGLAARWSFADLTVGWSLTVGQAAGALAALLVGQEAGIVSTAEVNATVLVILMSALAAGLSGDWALGRLPDRPSDDRPALGFRVVVPVANPESAPLLADVAVSVALQSGGMVVPVTVVPPSAADAGRQLVDTAEQEAVAAGAEAAGVVRVGTHVVTDLANLVVEQQGSCIVAGVPGSAVDGLGRVLGPLARHADVPVLLCHGGRLGAPTAAAGEGGPTARQVARAIDAHLQVGNSGRVDGSLLRVTEVRSLGAIRPDDHPRVWVVPPRSERLAGRDVTVRPVGL